jgi:hypothetical protein
MQRTLRCVASAAMARTARGDASSSPCSFESFTEVPATAGTTRRLPGTGAHSFLFLSVLQTERERKKRGTKGSRRGPLERGDADGEGDASVNAGLITGPTAGDVSLVSLARERRKRREGGPDTSKSSTRSALRLPLHWGLSQRRGLHRGLPARLRRRSSECATHESEKQQGSADDRERTERSGRGHRTMMPVQGESTASRVLRTDHSVRRSGGTRRTGKKDGGSNRRE